MKTIVTKDEQGEDVITEFTITPSSAYNMMLSFLQSVKSNLVDYFESIKSNFETLVVIGLASVQATHILSYLPYWASLPAWINPALVIPVAGVGLVSLLIWNNQQRNGYEDVQLSE